MSSVDPGAGHLPEAARTAPLRLTIGVVALAGCAVFLSASIEQGIGRIDAIGSGTFPALISLVGMVAAALVIVEALRARGDAARTVEVPTRSGYLRMAGFCGGVALFPVLLRPAGFLLASVAASTVVMRAAGQRSWLRAALSSLVFATALFLVFAVWLRVPLPRGPLWP